MQARSLYDHMKMKHQNTQNQHKLTQIETGNFSLLKSKVMRFKFSNLVAKALVVNHKIFVVPLIWELDNVIANQTDFGPIAAAIL